MDADDGPEVTGTTAPQAIALGLLMHALPMSPQRIRTSLAEAWIGLSDWALSVLQVVSLAGIP